MSESNRVSIMKTAIRASVRVARASIPADVRTRASHNLAAHLLALPEIASAHVVLAYAASAEEIDVAPAVDALRERGVRVVFPRICGPGELTLHDIECDADLEAGPFGIRQPCETSAECPRDEVDAVLVPGVAFDPVGRRLGYGGGYYDRLLPTLPAAATAIGVAFDEQLVPELPAEEHDARMGVVVTPSRVLRVS